jgi:raffinose/stachyose/melibiose transport system substrate-binding protein
MFAFHKELHVMKRVFHASLVLALVLIPLSFVVAQDDVVELTMGSWRTEDIEQWDAIIAAFNEEFPNIQISFEPTLNTEYDQSLRASLDAGGGPDLITCRPFDISLAMFEQGFLADVTDIVDGAITEDGEAAFGPVARSGWVSDDGASIYCIPMASVLHGFFYNEVMFEENGWAVPETTDEFLALLQEIEDSGVTPLALGTSDGWTNWTMGFHSNAPNWYGGEEGRQALIAGEVALTDPQFVEPVEFVLAWEPFLPDGYASIGYADTQQLFPLGSAAIFPAGSWDIPLFQGEEEEGFFKLAAFKPPVPEAGQDCYVTDHVDIGLGMNTNSGEAEQEAARTFLEWVAGPEFAALYTNQQPGFFSLSGYDIEIENEVAAEMASWKSTCDTTIRLESQYLSRGEVSPRLEAWRLFPAAFAGDVSAEDMMTELQGYLFYPEG